MKLENIKLITIDIDGTLCNNQSGINEETIKAIEKVKDKGIIVALCTGRWFYYSYLIHEKVKASNYLITSNGSELYDFNKNDYLFNSKINRNSIAFIWDYCLKNNINCYLNGNPYRYINKYCPIGTECKMINDIEEVNNIDIYQIIVESYNLDVMTELEQLITNNNLIIGNKSVSYSERKLNSFYSFDINNKGISKGKTLKYLLNTLQLKEENVLCFGDGENDISLFDGNYVKVAMGNAHPLLKEKADFITLSNEENGISYFIDKYF